MNHLIEFDTIIPFAQFCAELLRQGIAFTAHECPQGYHVILTGGY